jgi:DNA-binding transcriptional ArsR family regulator
MLMAGTVSVGLTASDVGSVRLHSRGSLLWETGLALRLLASPSPNMGYRDWVKAHVHAVSDERLSPLWCLFGDTPGIPCLTPPPSSNEGAVDEIALVRRMSPEEFEADLHRSGIRPSQPLRRILAQPASRWGDLLGDAMAAAADLLVRPLWPQIRSTVRADVAAWSQMAAEEGIASVINSVHERATFAGGRLTIRLLRTPTTREYDVRGAGVTLVPTVFAAEHLVFVGDVGHQPSLVFRTRSWSAVMDGLGPRVDSRLGRLLGDSRAAVLRMVVAPRSTTEIARSLGLSAANVSNHLTALRDGGLVVGIRAGRRVDYQVTRLGREILEHQGH